MMTRPLYRIATLTHPGSRPVGNNSPAFIPPPVATMREPVSNSAMLVGTTGPIPSAPIRYATVGH
jgi:hypothetical protein